jgi:hypothetical protein
MYEQEADPNQKEGVLRAHRNFLRQAVSSLYVYNRTKDAAYWFKFLGDKYPDKTIIDGDPNSYPRNLTLDKYVVATVQEDINDTSPDRMKTVLEGLLMNSYMKLVSDQDDHSEGLKLLAFQAWQSYQSKIPAERRAAIGLQPFKVYENDVLQRLLNPTNGLPPEPAAILRTKLGMTGPVKTSDTNATNQTGTVDKKLP